MRTILSILVLAVLVLPTALAEPRVVTKDYTYVPGPAVTGCGATAVYEHCFAVRPGETAASVDIADANGLAVPYNLIAAAPGAGAATIGTFCGSMDGLFVGLPPGTTSLRVNFDAQAAATCASVGTSGTITVTFG